MITDTKKSPLAALHGLEWNAVEWTGGLYRERFETCAEATVPHLQAMFEDREISHVLENFRIAAGEAAGEFDGTVFGDGDFYKWMEAAVYTAAKTGNTALLDKLEEYAGLIGRAQQPDGYLSTKQIIGERTGKASRLGDVNDFEVYNFGHLFTAACLYQRVTGRTGLLTVAERAAGYLKRLYAEAEQKGEVQTAVCPSHYMGLAELYRTTGRQEYLELLKQALRLRDSVKDGMYDNQDHQPLREHDRILGHAVRANYLYAGVADLCMEEADEELVEVLHRVWNSLVNTKLYLTGGCGALYNGASPYGNFFGHQLVHQAYGYEYQLPNVTSYNETCASVGGVYWAWRMLCMEKKPLYADVLERMLLNVNLAGVSLDGKHFFYENMLRRAKQLPYELVWGQERAEYILSYCCPPNLARLLAQTTEYAYAADASGIYTVLYGASRARISRADGELVLVQETEYPYNGRIRFTFEEVGTREEFTLYLRIPAWVRTGGLKLARAGRCEEKRQLTHAQAGSYLAVQIARAEELELLLELGMEPRLTCAHPLVEEAAGQAAVECGPLVYCIEGVDICDGTLDDLAFPSELSLVPEELVLEGRTVQALRGRFLRKRHSGDWQPEALYQDYESLGYEELEARLIPYFAWANRGMSEMRIWLPVAER